MDISFLIEEVEKVSQGYADRLGITRDPDWFVLKLQEELGELVQSYLMMSGRARKNPSAQSCCYSTTCVLTFKKNSPMFFVIPYFSLNITTLTSKSRSRINGLYG